MKSIIFAALAATASAANAARRFGVVRFNGDGPLMDCRIDAIVQPGGPSSHVHTFMGGSNIGWSSTGEDLRKSPCSNTLLNADKSAYWFPKLYFKDPSDGKLEPVPFYYAAIYYFFEPTNDDIKAFPLGLQMVSGNAMTRTAPVKTNINNLDPSKGPVSPAVITCPRTDPKSPTSWPAGSDGSSAGIGDPNNLGQGIGFPLQVCDGLYSPMRIDVHMPSCYNPAAGLTAFRSNTAFPTDAGNGRQDCPKGWVHLPHMFYETYWDTQKFASRMQGVVGKESPFVFSNGDTTGFSAHADFLAGWDETALQQIIDNCNVGHESLHTCPGLIGGVNTNNNCKATCPVQETVSGKLDKLPGNNPLSGFKYGSGGSATTPDTPVVNPPANSNSTAPSAPAESSPASVVVSSDPYAASPVPTTLIPRPPVMKIQEEEAVSDAESTTSVPSAEPTAAPIVPAPVAGSDKSTAVVWETVTVYQTKTVYNSPGAAPTSAPTTKEDVAGFKYAGCFGDTKDRVLAGDILPNIGKVTNELCVKHCADKGFSAAGTQYGGECFCGNALSKVDKIAEDKCSMACEGGAGECGGTWALSLYTKDGKVPTAAVPEKRRRHMHDHMMHHRRSW
ncbi:hypothetical protein QBC39DRAFT_170053 [Podospora conica]|nr:hypothetical protein QBC39DRAFT_170053 [Schizothecium conicum]